MSLLGKLFGKKKQPDSISPLNRDQGSLPRTPEERFAALSADDRLGAIISLGDTGQHKYYDLLKYCIQTDPDIDLRFAALKRIHLFKTHPDLIPFLKILKASANARDLEPYLSMALSRVGLITEEEFQHQVNRGAGDTPAGKLRWITFDKGSSLGTVGSERGRIIADIECIDGARVTIEKDSKVAPFSVTTGIYGLMFHTHFCDTEVNARKFMDFSISKIDEIFSLYETPETERDSIWHEKRSRLMSELAEQ